MSTFHKTAPEPPPRDEWGFIEELRQPLPFTTNWQQDAVPDEEELNLGEGVAYHGGFNDKEGRLVTAEDDLRQFLQQADIQKDGGLPITTGRTDELSGESFRLDVSASEIQILAGEAGGIRRGIYHLEEMISGAKGPFLKIGVTDHEPWLRNRLSRCFFGPIKRPPFNHDELMDEIDYYPDEYLNRLAHEGVNGLWLTIAFRDICKTSITELDPDALKRLEKLRYTVEKCLRYGIKTWAFCIEPRAFEPGDPLLEKYPELGGAEVSDQYCFCPSSEVAQRYLYESTQWLFSHVPGLGGLLGITHGERMTTCLSSVGCTEEKPVECPRCGQIPKWQILHNSLSAMRDGMRQANPEAQLISWFYMPTPMKRADWVFEAANHVPEGVILQYNFESNGMKTQLGKPRIGGDYWLSYTGPCDDFARVASRAADANTELSAKIQVGCSHEVATIPFVPVPGLLYRKYRKMREQGCSNVMQCWYFGNYPGVMNRAAGLLAYENFEDTEEAFLLRLARPEWGSDTPAVVQAWQILAEGYSHFPMTNVFQYYGPIQDGVVWPLHLKPAMKPLAPSWKPGFPPSGDTIGECLEHFTLPEALDLCEKMSAQWHRGSEIFQALRPRFQNDLERLRDIGLVEALDIQIRSGRNILRFYHLRSLLINRRIPDPVRTLDEMYTIATEEMNHSLRLRELCSTDSRLGFHSEAESHKYYPSKLEWRAGQLQHLLQTDFAEVRQAMESGEGFPASVPDAPSYRCGSGWIQCSHFRWRMDNEEGDIVVRVECKTASEGDTFLFLHLIDRAGTQYPTTFRYSPHGLVINEGWGEIIVEEETADLSRIRIIVPAISWDMEPARKPAWFSLYYTVRAIGRESIEETWPAIEGPVPSRLRIGYFNPEHLALLEASN